MSPLAPATIAEGVLGLEGQHTFNGLTLNDPDVWPRYKLRKIGGLHARADWAENAIAATGRLGELPYPSLLRGKTVTYEGEIRARSLVELRQARRDLLAAFSTTVTGDVVVAPHPSRGGVSHRYGARPVQVDVDDEQTHGPGHRFRRGFVIGLRQYDPRYFADTTQEVVDAAAGTATPFVNDGSAAAEPIWSIPGNAALDQVDLRNQTTNRKLLFTGLTGLVDAGQTLVVDFATREVYTLPDETDLSGRLDPTLSDWWDEGVEGVVPGANNLWGGGAGTTTYSVGFDPANW